VLLAVLNDFDETTMAVIHNSQKEVHLIAILMANTFQLPVGAKRNTSC